MGETGNVLYHVTHIHNLGGIFVSNILCWDAAHKRRGWTPFPDTVVHRRKELIPLTSKDVTEYVPLSFCSDSPFLYDLTDDASSWGQHQHRRTYHAPVDNDDVAILCLDGARVLELPGVIYSDADDRSRSVHFYESWELPSHVDWAAVTALTCLDDDVKARKAAEVLVPGYVPASLMTSVILYSHDALEYVQDELCALAQDNFDGDKRFARFINMLRVSPDRFFPQYAGEH
jgi:hypothetical protein